MEDDELEKRIRQALSLHIQGIYQAQAMLYTQAIESFRQAIEIEPIMVVSYVELGLVYATTKEYRKMFKVLQQGVSISAEGIRAYLSEEPFGDRPMPSPPPDTSPQKMTAEERHGHAQRLMQLALSHLSSKSDLTAIGGLELSLNIEQENPIAVMLLTLAYILSGGKTGGIGGVSILSTIAPEVAEELFG